MSAVTVPKSAAAPGAGGWSALSPAAFNQNGRLAEQQQALPSQAAPAVQQQPALVVRQQAPPVQQAAPVQQQLPVTPKKAPSYSFETLDTYKWSNNKDTSGVLDGKPLLIGLQHSNLSTKEQLNVSNLGWTSAHNPTNELLGVQLKNVNGVDIKRVLLPDGEWATLALHPGQTVDLHHLNNGDGLSLASNPLDYYGNVNVQVSPEDFPKWAKTHPQYIDPVTGKPTHYIVDVDLSGFKYDPANPNKSPDEKMASANPLGRVIYANAKRAFAELADVENFVGGKLLPLNADDVYGPQMLPSIRITPDLVSPSGGSFHALVDVNEYNEVVDLYKKSVASKAQPTNANDLGVKVIRIGKKPGDVPVVPISVQLGLKWEVNHNGKPFTGEKATK